MNQILRFWLVMVPLLVGFTATGYLSATFFLHDSRIISAGPDVRLLLTLVALVGYAGFAGVILLFGSSSALPVSDQRDRNT
jgi:hypothetical protein